MPTGICDAYLAVDWSARHAPSPRQPCADALWIGEADATGQVATSYWRTRHACVAYLRARLRAHLYAGRRVLIGYDFGFGFPAGFAAALGLPPSAPPWSATWSYLASLITDAPDNANNRFAVAAQLNAICATDAATQTGPFWGHPPRLRFPTLGQRGPAYPFPTRRGPALRRFRWTDQRERGIQPAWRVYGTASVGGQMLLGIPAVARLRWDPDLTNHSAIWPFETGFAPPDGAEPRIIHAEIWPGMLAAQLDPAIPIRDQAQVSATVAWLAATDASGALAHYLAPPKDLDAASLADCCNEEGWIVGSGVMRR